MAKSLKRTKVELEAVEANKKVIDVLKRVDDPELGLDIWLLGLVYDLHVDQKNVHVVMTLTTPFCPFGPQIIGAMKEGLEEEGFTSVTVDVVFDPLWEPSKELRELMGF